jgi:hypothetical protein
MKHLYAKQAAVNEQKNNFVGKHQVPISQCSLKENTKFLRNFRPKNKTLRGNF